MGGDIEMKNIIKTASVTKVIATGFSAIFGIVIMLLIAAAIFAIPVYFLWNWIIPQVFGLPELTLFQAWGMLTLCQFLFKSTVKKSRD